MRRRVSAAWRSRSGERYSCLVFFIVCKKYSNLYSVELSLLNVRSAFRGMNRREFNIALAWAWGSLALGIPATGQRTGERKRTMQSPMIVDLEANPNLQFRIDAFKIPAASREEFEAAMRRNLAFLEKLPGFLHHMVFEKTSGPTEFNLVTIAVWESAEAIAAAGEKVRAYYQSIGFDVQATLTRLGITASLGYYNAPANLQ
ncbi:antibiotic biosynthesis monooxygenase [Acidobacteria bacterium AB60]|nr:antibiotic biosynthesis monooxygenase [Acidobacteria bacterium AB60]